MTQSQWDWDPPLPPSPSLALPHAPSPPLTFDESAQLVLLFQPGLQVEELAVAPVHRVERHLLGGRRILAPRRRELGVLGARGGAARGLAAHRRLVLKNGTK